MLGLKRTHDMISIHWRENQLAILVTLHHVDMSSDIRLATLLYLYAFIIFTEFICNLSETNWLSLKHTLPV